MDLFYSKFIYGFSFDESNNKFDLSEGAGQIQVVIPIGAYTVTKFCLVLKSALNAVGTLGYNVVLDRSNFTIKITAEDGPFEILGDSGLSNLESCLPVMGFPMEDSGMAIEHTGGTAGKSYTVPFPVQSFVPPERSKSLTNATVLKSASGNNVSVQYFGEEKIMELNIRLVSNISQPANSPLRTNNTGVEDLQDLLDYCIQLSPVEFITDESKPDNFYRVRLESTQESQSGTAYKLKEHWDMNLPNYFETGVIKFRVIEESY